MSDSNYSNRNDNSRSGNSKDESVFSWSNEYEAYKKSYSAQKNSRKPENYNPEDSIFTGRSQRYSRDSSRYNNYGLDYHYDYPDEDYKYDPKADFGRKKEFKSDYDNSIYTDFMSGISSQGAQKNEPRQTYERNFANRQKRRTPEQRQTKGEERRSYNQKSQSGRKTLTADKSQKKKNQSASEPMRGGKQTQRIDKTKNKSAAASDKAKKTKDKKAEKKNKKAARQKKNPALMSNSEKKRAAKKEKKEKKKIDVINRRIEKLKASGYSNDEIRAKMQRELIMTEAFRTFFIILCVLIAVALVLGFAGVIYGFPAQTIKVNGANVYKEDEILTAGELSVGDNMLLVSQKNLSKKISTALPYVKSVEIKRVLPDTLILNVKETADKLLFVTDKGYICTDESGKVTSEKKQAAKDGKIKIEGFESQEYELGKKFVPDKENGNERKYELVNQIIAALDACEIKDCNLINIENLNLIVLSCGKQMKIYLDSHVDFEYKLSMLSKQFVSDELNPSGPYYYDLRFDGQIVYKEGELS